MSTRLMDALPEEVKNSLREEFKEEAEAADKQKKSAQALTDIKKHFEKKKADQAAAATPNKNPFIITNNSQI